MLGGVAVFAPGPEKSRPEAANCGRELAEWCQQQGNGWDLEAVEREAGPPWALGGPPRRRGAEKKHWLVVA